MNEHVKALHDICLATNSTATQHRNFFKALKLLKYTSKTIDPKQANDNILNILIWSSIACTHYFYNEKQLKRPNWRQNRNYKISLKLHQNIVKIFVTNKSEFIFNSTLSYITELKLWKYENFCQILLQNMLSYNTEQYINYLLTFIKYQITNNTNVAEIILRILYHLLQYPNNNLITPNLFYVFLEMFKHNLIQQNQSYDNLRIGFEVCLKHMIANTLNPEILRAIRIMIKWIFDKKITDEYLLNFGNVIEYAAKLYKTYLYANALSNDLFPLILKLILSENSLHNLLGNRIFQHILDRNNNRQYLKTPQLFRQDMMIQLKINDFNPNDRSFLKTHRELLHDILILSIIHHGKRRLNLQSTYTSIALIAVEIPCCFTAAAITCLVMNIQKYTLYQKELTKAATHRLHATVISIISLICCIHKANTLYDCVNRIIERRAEYAPYLNPPLKSSYQYAEHHAIWNKNELFFDEWEIRYGLWKCFRHASLKLV